MSGPTFVDELNSNTSAIQSDINVLSKGIASVADAALSISKDLTHEAARINALTLRVRSLERSLAVVGFVAGIGAGAAVSQFIVPIIEGVIQ